MDGPQLSNLSKVKQKVDGVTRCTRYAFGPNTLRMCGPDAHQELSAYLRENVSDDGLTALLKQFKTLYPYLQSIASANHLKDPFDPRVVEAYWIGNELLEMIQPKSFFVHLTDSLALKKKTSPKDFNELVIKLPQGARMHHSFHVFNVYKRTGHLEILHSLESMDACRVSWGRITRIDGPKVFIRRKPLKLRGQQLVLADEEDVELHRQLDTDDILDEANIGDWITLHWFRPCEIVTERNIHWLEFYTTKHLQLANQTL